VAREDRRALRGMASELVSGQAGIIRPLRIQPYRRESVDIVVSASVCRDGNSVPECIFWIFLHPLERLNEDIL